MLDEALQAFPVESLPCLRDISCSRIPSLPLLLSLSSFQNETKPTKKAGKSAKSAAEPTGLAVDPRRCWFALDVDRNLSATRATMLEFLQPFVEQLGWKGVIGQVPERDLLRYASVCDYC